MENIVLEAKKNLIEAVKATNPKADLEKIEEAVSFAYKAHSKQLRASGEPYILHPIAVAKILTELKLDSTSIITALLHDTVEDTEITLNDIKKSFGKEVAQLVDGVTKLDKIEYQPENIKQAENFRKLLLAISIDIRVLLVKLADRIHNMRTINHIQNEKKKHRLAHETMEIYAPLAERIGVHTFKNELQDLSLEILHPEARNSILTRLEFLRDSSGNIISSIEKEIKTELKKHNIKADVSGREKTTSSIWYKMQQKDVTFEQITDIVAFRIIVDEMLECYRALGVIHSKYHTVSDGFKDYISTPKINGYQSIHTLIMGPGNRCIEIQIRTKKMHEIAEFGVAAHWAYKQGVTKGTQNAQIDWIRRLISILETTQSPEEFLENTKLEMYYDQVFCFSPKGEIIPLPKFATPIDFAFAIHSDLGLSCIGAKVNGKLVPLRTHLNNGDQVEILTSKVPVPSTSWESLVVTGKAKAEIRKFIRARQVNEYITLGRALLSKSFSKAGKNYDDKLLEPLLTPLKKQSVAEILSSIGEGSLSRNEVIKVFDKISEVKKPRFSLSKLSPKKLFSSKDTYSMPINGMMPGVALHFAGCCNPIPGDEILGVVNTGKGITIHTSICNTSKTFSNTPERLITVSWDGQSGELFAAKFKIIISNEVGSLADMTHAIAKTSANISSIKTISKSLDFSEILIDVEVKNTNHLNDVLVAVRMVSCVHTVERVRG